MPAFATVRLRELALADAEAGDEVRFCLDPVCCGHTETMCPACYHEWLVDHEVALPAVYRQMFEAMSNAHGAGELRFKLR